MKKNPLLTTMAAVILTALASVTMYGQVTATSTARASIGTKISAVQTAAANSLNRILEDTNMTPLGLYPPGYLDMLAGTADGTLSLDKGMLMQFNDMSPDALTPPYADNYSANGVKYTQTQNILFEEAGGNHHYVGQLVKFDSDVSLVQVNMEMRKCPECGGVSGEVVDAEVWQTDLGNSWVHVANSLTVISQMDANYAVRVWDFGTPVTLSAGHSYFLGVNVQSAYVEIRGDHSGFAGTGTDLNNGIGAPDAYYQQSWGSPQNSDQSGAGTGYVTTYSFIFSDAVAGWIPKINTQPTEPVYGVPPTKVSGKDSLVVITHGWIAPLDWSSADASVAFVDTMSNSITSYLSAHGINNWQAYGYRWVNDAKTTFPNDALNNATQEGILLGNSIVLQGWTHVHLIAHSAGAALIQKALETIKAASPSTTVHCTFLDAYVRTDYSGLTHYGNGADWSDSYFTHDGLTGGELWPLTEGAMTHAYNANVTFLDPNKISEGEFFSSTTGATEPCFITASSHGWPIDFYANTITGSGVTSDYAGFGFPLSEEGGNWSYALAHYTVGNSTPQVLGTPDPTCVSDVQLTPPTYPDTTVDFTQLPSVKSTTGTVQKYVDSLHLFTGSPSWLATYVSSANPINLISFDANFTSTNGAQGLLSVFWDGDTIGTIDERTAQSGFNHYHFGFPTAFTNTTHVLGFRLDPYTNIQSSVIVTNIALNQIGSGQPFSLSLTGTSTNGALVYQLTGEAGFTYGIQASTNLTDWVSIASLVNTNGAVRFFEQTSTNYSVRFYRGVTP